MTFGIDYHGTFAEDLDGFRALVKLLQSRGHTCVLVTGINDGTPWAAEIKRNIGTLMPIVFACGAWKEVAAKRAGYDVTVWIDDQPHGIKRPSQDFINGRDKWTDLLQKT
jgi:hypothetical protein